MTLNTKNQNDILEAFEIDEIYEDKAINRMKIKPKVEDKIKLLDKLKEKIKKIENCELKSHAKQIVFGDGNYNCSLMIVGEGPGQKEDDIGKPFVGDAGALLNKMLQAIKINRKDIYITNVVNFKPPNNRKPNKDEINRYSSFLKEHISIVNPRILILMGSTAMEALLGSNNKISNVRGLWRDLIIDNLIFRTLVTFHPAYLLRQPEQKKYSWEDLKKIRKEMDNLGVNFFEK